MKYVRLDFVMNKIPCKMGHSAVMIVPSTWEIFFISAKDFHSQAKERAVFIQQRNQGLLMTFGAPNDVLSVQKGCEKVSEEVRTRKIIVHRSLVSESVLLRNISRV